MPKNCTFERVNGLCPNTPLMEEKESKHDSPPGQEGTILVAEDVIENFLLLKAMLTHYGLRVLHASNGKEAVRFCEEHPEIDLILMDLQMPELNGLEASRIIKSSHPDLPIIAVSGYSVGGERDLALEYGCSDLIAKPFSIRELISRVGRYVPLRNPPPL